MSAPVNESVEFSLHAIAAAPDTWITVSALAFVALFIRYVWPVIAGSLDDRAQAIRHQLEQASRLREEAAALLSDVQARHAQSAADAQALIARARNEAQALRERAAADLEAVVARRRQQALDKIARAEAAALEEVRTRMIAVATTASATLLRESLATQNDPTISETIRVIGDKIH